MKDFRTVVARGSETITRKFIENNFESHKQYFIVVARYAYLTLIGPAVDQIVTHYGDEFNATYEHAGEGITITNKDQFNKIVTKVLEIIEATLKEANLAPTNFMKNIFEI